MKLNHQNFEFKTNIRKHDDMRVEWKAPVEKKK